MKLVLDDGREIQLDTGRARALVDLLWAEAQPRSGSISAAATLQQAVRRASQAKVELDTRESQAVERALRLLEGSRECHARLQMAEDDPEAR